VPHVGPLPDIRQTQEGEYDPVRAARCTTADTFLAANGRWCPANWLGGTREVGWIRRVLGFRRCDSRAVRKDRLGGAGEVGRRWPGGVVVWGVGGAIWEDRLGSP
jgi:hypothetical protein